MKISPVDRGETNVLINGNCAASQWHGKRLRSSHMVVMITRDDPS
jgi:hypothetical protein